MPDLKIKPFTGDSYYIIPDVPSIMVNWEINRAGMLSASLTVEQVNQFFVQLHQTPAYRNISTMAGMVIRFDHEAAGSWAGQIVQFGGSNGIIQVSALGYESLLRKKVFKIETLGGSDNTKHPGLILKDIVQKYNGTNDEDSDSRLQLKIPTESETTAAEPFLTDEPGDTADVRVKTTADVYDEVIPAITEDIGYEWNVTADGRVMFARQLGIDRSSGESQVTLVEGESVTSVTWADDFSSVTNSLIGFYVLTDPGTSTRGKKGKQPKKSQQSVVVNSTSSSISQFGILRERRDYPEVSKPDTVKNRLYAELRTMDQMRPLITVETVNTNGIWSRFRQGDTVYLNTSHSGYTGTFRILVRSLDVGRGVMMLSGYGDARTG